MRVKNVNKMQCDVNKKFKANVKETEKKKSTSYRSTVHMYDEKKNTFKMNGK